MYWTLEWLIHWSSLRPFLSLRGCEIIYGLNRKGNLYPKQSGFYLLCNYGLLSLSEAYQVLTWAQLIKKSLHLVNCLVIFLLLVIYIVEPMASIRSLLFRSIDLLPNSTSLLAVCYFFNPNLYQQISTESVDLKSNNRQKR